MRLSALFVVLLVCFNAVSEAQTPASQVAALEDFYDSLGGAQWKNNSNWLEGDPCANFWNGLACVNYNVTGIVLPNNNLNGTFPASLTNLTLLETLYVQGNEISGTLEVFMMLPFLRLFDVSANQLTGPLPLDQASFFQSIFLMNVSHNHLSGPMPVLTGFIILQNFSANNNQLNGSLAFGSDLYALSTLDLSFNDLSGNLPLVFPPKLTFFNASNNNFEGPLPDFTGTLLQTLNLNFNNLSGSIPTSLKSLRTLQDLELSHNQFSGLVPFFVDPNSISSTGLRVFDISHNQLSGTVYTFSAPYLRVYDISSNRFTGSVPSTFSTYYYLSHFDISDNQLTYFYYNFGSMYYLHYLNVSHNKFSSTLPTSYPNNIQVVDFSFNSFVGGVPYNIPATLQVLNLQNNKITGYLSSAFLSSTGLLSFNVSTNSMYGGMPVTSYSRQPIRSLDLSHNGFGGPIPSNWGSYKLEVLLLQNNKFTGTLPSFLQTQPANLTFNASGNQFTCPIPQWCDASSGNGECSPCVYPSNTPTPSSTPPYNPYYPYPYPSQSPYPHYTPSTNPNEWLAWFFIAIVVVFFIAIGALCACRSRSQQLQQQRQQLPQQRPPAYGNYGAVLPPPPPVGRGPAVDVTSRVADPRSFPPPPPGYN